MERGGRRAEGKGEPGDEAGGLRGCALHRWRPRRQNTAQLQGVARGARSLRRGFQGAGAALPGAEEGTRAKSEKGVPGDKWMRLNDWEKG